VVAAAGFGVSSVMSFGAFAVSDSLPVSTAAPNSQTKLAMPTASVAHPAVPYWSQGESRVFVSGTAAVGLGSARLTLASGYGQPHWMWAGVETTGYVSPYFGAFQGGLHVDALLAEASLAFRHTASFEYGSIAAVPSVGHSELVQNKDKISYNSLDASLWGYAPYRDLLLAWELTYARPLGFGDSLLFEEYQRVVVGRHGLFTTKLAPMVQLRRTGLFYVGVLGEQLSLIGRTETMVFRLGPTLWGKLGDHWNIIGCWSLPVYSPDRLGAWVGSYVYLSVSYAFATGDEGTKQ
jgi:hypothetical protein